MSIRADEVADRLLGVAGSIDRKWISTQVLPGLNVVRPKMFWRRSFGVEPAEEWVETTIEPGPPTFVIDSPHLRAPGIRASADGSFLVTGASDTTARSRPAR